MGNPIDRYLQGQGATENPIDQWLRNNQRKAELRLRLSSAKGRMRFLQENPPDIAKGELQTLIDDPETDNDTRTRFVKMLDVIARPDRPGLLGTVEDFGRGAAAGAVTAIPMAVDLALGIPDLANRVVGNSDNVFRTGRNAIQDVVAQVNEDFDARGTAGTVGNVAGSLVGGVVPYGAAANVVGKAIAAAAPTTRVAQAIRAATGPGASLGQKVAANVATGVPINAVQAATMDDATLGERAKTFALGTVMDAGFPVLFNPRQALAAARGKAQVEVAVGNKIADAPTPDSPQVFTADMLIKKGEEIEAAKKLKVEQTAAYKQESLRAVTEAKADWIKQNPGGQWADINKAERKALIQEYVVNNPERWQTEGMRKRAGADVTKPAQPEPVFVPKPETTSDINNISDVVGAAPRLGEQNLEAAETRSDMVEPDPDGIILPKPSADVTPQSAAAPVPSPLKTLHIDRSLTDIAALPPDQAKSEFKRLKLAWSDGDSVLDNLKENIYRKQGDAALSAGAADDLQLLSKLTQAQKQQIELSKPDPASPEGIIAKAKAELVPAPKPTPTPAEPQPLSVKQTSAWFKLKSFESMAPDDLGRFEQWLDDKVTSLDMVTGTVYKEKLHQIMEWKSQQPPPAIQANANTWRVMRSNVGDQFHEAEVNGYKVQVGKFNTNQNNLNDKSWFYRIGKNLTDEVGQPASNDIMNDWTQIWDYNPGRDKARSIALERATQLTKLLPPAQPIPRTRTDAEADLDLSRALSNDIIKRLVVTNHNIIPGENSLVLVSDIDAPLEYTASVAKSQWARMLSKVMGATHEALRNGLASRDFPDVFTDVSFGGFILDDRVRGVHIAARGFNDAPNASVNLQSNLIMYNPFALLDGTVDPEYAADVSMGVMIHEWGHQGGGRDVSTKFEQDLTELAGVTRKMAQTEHDRLRAVFRYLSNNKEFLDAKAEYLAHRARNVRGDVNSGYAAASGTSAFAAGSERVTPNGSGSRTSVSPSTATLATPQPSSDGPTPARETVRPSASSYITPGLKGGASGLVFGVAATDPDDPNYWAKVAMYSAIGAGGNLAIKGLWKRDPSVPKPTKPTEIIGTSDLDSRVVGVDQVIEQRPPMMSVLRSFYQGTIRSTYEVERVYRALGLQDLPAQFNASKLMQTWGRHVAMIESWLTRQPAYVDNAGQITVMLDDAGKPLKPLQRILTETAQGNKEDLGKLAVARTSLELYSRGRKAPMTPDEATQVIRNAPEYLQVAADELRQYHKGLLRVLLATGRISQDGYNKMVEEVWYTPLQRLATGDKNSLQQAIQKQNIKGPKDIFAREKGGVSGYAVENPYDVTVEMTARILRSAEFHNVVNTMYRNLETVPGDAGKLWMHRGENRTNAVIEKLRSKAGVLAKELDVSREDAEGMLSFMDEEIALQQTADKKTLLTGYDKGKLVTYEVNSGFFEAFRAMQPIETELVLKILAAPARVASAGVVHNPMFAGTQFFIDTFTATLTSQHRFRPGWDSIRGWLAVARNDPRYIELLQAGGPSTVQSLKYTGELESAVRAVSQAGKTPLETAVHQFKEYNFIDAMKSLLTPFAEAARVGEYLRALDHGESVLEATYAAWNVMGNVKLQGSAKTMRALNLITMFLRPAISGVDEVYYRTGLPHPRRNGEFDARQAANFGLMGVAGIALPSALLWWANKDDNEINQLRRTEAGARYWWIRKWDGEIMKLRKPHLIGQVFGTATEQALDKMYAENPQGTANWLETMFQDAAPSLLPTVGVIPYALWSNKVPGLGSQIIPTRDSALEPHLQGGERASLPARVVADKLRRFSSGPWAPEMLQRFMSPAGIDMAVRTVGGMWGEDGMKAITWAHEWVTEDMPPPKAEAPIIGRLFVKQPTTNVGPVRMFYSMAEKIDTKAKTVAQYSASDPKRLIGYMPEAMPYLMLADSYNKTRGEINQLWRAVYDIRAMPNEMIPQATKRKLEESFTKQIVAKAWAANLQAEVLLK